MKKLHYYEIPVLVDRELCVFTTYSFGYLTCDELIQHIRKTSTSVRSRKAIKLLKNWNLVYPKAPTIEEPESNSGLFILSEYDDGNDDEQVKIEYTMTFDDNGEVWSHLSIKCPDLGREKEILKLKSRIIELERMVK